MCPSLHVFGSLFQNHLYIGLSVYVLEDSPSACQSSDVHLFMYSACMRASPFEIAPAPFEGPEETDGRLGQESGRPRRRVQLVLRHQPPRWQTGPSNSNANVAPSASSALATSGGSEQQEQRQSTKHEHAPLFRSCTEVISGSRAMPAVRIVAHRARRRLSLSSRTGRT